MTPALTRAARGYLDWTQSDLARLAGCNLSTIRDFESGERRTIPAVVVAIERAFIGAGMKFGTVYWQGIDGPQIAMAGP